MRKGLTAIKNIKKEYFSHTKGRDVFFSKISRGGGGELIKMFTIPNKIKAKIHLLNLINWKCR